MIDIHMILRQRLTAEAEKRGYISVTREEYNAYAVWLTGYPNENTHNEQGLLFNGVPLHIEGVEYPKLNKTTYNNGKDLMPGDIKVVKVQPMDVVTKEPTGPARYIAYLGFIVGEPPILNLQSAMKFYMASAETEEQAKRDLVETLKDHLERAIS